MKSGRIRIKFDEIRSDPDPVFEIRSDPDPVFEIRWDPVFETRSDPDSVFELGCGSGSSF